MKKRKRPKENKFNRIFVANCLEKKLRERETTDMPEKKNQYFRWKNKKI